MCSQLYAKFKTWWCPVSRWRPEFLIQMRACCNMWWNGHVSCWCSDTSLSSETAETWDATDEQWVELALLLKLVPDTGRMQMLTGWLIVVTEYWRRLIASEDRTDRYAVWLHRVEMMTWRASWWVWGHSLVLTSLIDSTHTNRVEWRYSGTVGSTSLCQ